MSKSYDELFENPADQEYVTRSALPNGGTLIIQTLGLLDIANRFIPEAKRDLGTLQSVMATNKVSQYHTHKDIPTFEEKVTTTLNGHQHDERLSLTGYIDIFATNGYGTFPDTGKIVISITEKEEEGGWQEARCIGYIIQNFVDTWDSTWLWDQRYVYHLEDPQGHTLYNDDTTLMTATEAKFVGYPDNQTKYAPVGEWIGYDYGADVDIVSETDVEIVFVLDREIVKTFDFRGPITYSPSETFQPWIAPGHSRVGPGPYAASGICGDYGYGPIHWYVYAADPGVWTVFSGVLENGEWLIQKTHEEPFENVVYTNGWTLQPLGAGCQPDVPVWVGLTWWPEGSEDMAVGFANETAAWYYQHQIEHIRNEQDHYYIWYFRSPNLA